MSDTVKNNDNATLSDDVEHKEETKSSNIAKDAIENPPETPNYDLKKFHLQRILNNNTRNKSIVVLGSFPDLSDSDLAIVIFEKTAFQESQVDTVSASEEQLGEKSEKPSYFCNDLRVQTDFINNIYGSYLCTPPATLAIVKATVIYPATFKHIEKYSIRQKFVINETPELYKEVTLPYITSTQFSLDWVYNILDHKKEVDRIIFEDPDPENGFILLPDLKWDGHNSENLYALVITRKRDIKSLRDLNSSHLSLLRNIRRQAANAIESRYGIPVSQLRMYFHYQPSFYHLHIHINPIRNDAPGIGCDKSHMLDTVINNLELLTDYYKNATLPCVLYDGDKHLDLFEDKISIRKAKKRLVDDKDNEVEKDAGIKVKKQKLG